MGGGSEAYCSFPHLNSSFQTQLIRFIVPYRLHCFLDY